MAKVYYKGDNSNRGPSPGVWAECPWMDMVADPNVGYYLWEDFINMLEATGGWLTAGTNETALYVATEIGGVFQVGATGADNDEGYITSGNNEAGFCKIYTTAPKRLWFECRVRTTSIVDQGVFFGLSEEGLAAADTLANNSAALASKDFVGFHADTAAPTVLDAVYREAGETAIVAKASAQVIAAATWYKLGMVFDGTFLNWYVNGVREPLTAAVTGVDVGHGLNVGDATTFPDGEELAVLLGVHDGEGAAKSIDIDWIRVAQEV